MWVIVLGLTAFLIAFYYTFYKPQNFWKNQGVKQPNALEYFYYNWLSFLKKRSAADMVVEMYNLVPNARYYGLHQFNIPGIIIKDPELLKLITIKHSDHFTEHRFVLPETIDPVIGKSLISLHGKEWREMRNILSPTFTSSKMKILFHLIIECAEKFVNFFEEKNEDLITVEMQDVTSRFTNDVIASVIFGIEINSLKEPTNEFYVNNKKLTDIISFWQSVKFILAVAFPRFYKFFDIRLFNENLVNFFRKLVEQSIKLREENVLKRADMIHLLLEARKENNAQVKEDKLSDLTESVDEGKPTKIITNDDIVAQVFTFSFAGFESSSRFMCFAAYELALNPDIQEKLREEIRETMARCDGKLNYEALVGMKYLDNVLSEVLRKYPTQVGTDRVCTKSFVLEPEREDEKPVFIAAGITMGIPTFGIHNDPDIFPDPHRFDPDRFNEENKKNIPPYAYHPFGLGPRSCIGNRFAILEVKAAFFFLLYKFEIVPIEKTAIPLVLLKSQLSLSAEGGFWLGLKRIL